MRHGIQIVLLLAMAPIMMIIWLLGLGLSGGHWAVWLSGVPVVVLPLTLLWFNFREWRRANVATGHDAS